MYYFRMFYGKEISYVIHWTDDKNILSYRISMNSSMEMNVNFSDGDANFRKSFMDQNSLKSFVMVFGSKKLI